MNKKDKFFALTQEVLLSKRINDEKLDPIVKNALMRYTGRHRPTFGQNWTILLNEVYPVVQRYIPNLMYRVPRAFLKPRTKTYIAKKRNLDTDKMEEVFMDSTKSAETQENILNYNLQDMDYKRESQKVLVDSLIFPHGILWHGYKGGKNTPGTSFERSFNIRRGKIFVKRVAPQDFYFDPAVNIVDLDEARWIARRFMIPYDDLVADASLTVDKNQVRGVQGYGDPIHQYSPGLFGFVGGDRIKTAPLLGITDKKYQQSTACRFVECFEVFKRPTAEEEQEGSNGEVTLFTFEQDKPLKESDWSYKAKGWPGHVLQFNPINDEKFGLADVQVYGPIADQKNAITNIQMRNAEETSKVWVGISKENIRGDEDLEKIKEGTNTILVFDDGDPAKRLHVASAGNVASQELYLAMQGIDRNLQDKSGISDLDKGFLQSGEESAASVKLRSAGSSARAFYRQDTMADFLKKSFLYINELDKQYFTIDEAVRVVGSLDIEWSENPTKEDIQAAVDVEIDAISMLPENPEQELQAMNQVLQMQVNAISDPIVKMKLEEEGYTTELAPTIQNILLRLKVRNPSVFRRIKPEESEGFVKVSELRMASDNIKSALAGKGILSPPEKGQDHKARISVYENILQLIQELGDTQAAKDLVQVIEQHMMLAEEEKEEKSPEPGQMVKPLRKPIEAE